MQKEQNRGVYVFDIETILNCFTYTALNIDTKELIAIYETVTEASIKTGVDRRRISDYCNKRRNKRPFKKRIYLWEYL